MSSKPKQTTKGGGQPQKKKKGAAVPQNRELKPEAESQNNEKSVEISQKAILAEYMEQIVHMTDCQLAFRPDPAKSPQEVRSNMERLAVETVEEGLEMSAAWRKGVILVLAKNDATAKFGIEMWSTKFRDPPPSAYAFEMKTTESRKLRLEAALYQSLKDEKSSYDEDALNKVLRNLQFRNTAEAALEHPEFSYYLKRGIGGLIIHGCNMTWPDDRVERRMSPFVRLMPHAFGGFPNVLRLTYAAGFNTTPQKAEADSVEPGTQACLRHLCAQIIRHEFVKLHGLGLKFLAHTETAKVDEVLWHIAGGASTWLLSVFRQLIYDIARTVYTKKLKKQVIEVILDGVEWLDDDRLFRFVVYVFRSICTEVKFGELGEYVQFRYLLLHTSVWELASEPSCFERHLIWRSDEDARLLKEKVNTKDDSRSKDFQIENMVQSMKAFEQLGLGSEYSDNTISDLDMTRSDENDAFTSQLNSGDLPNLSYTGLHGDTKVPFWSVAQGQQPQGHENLFDSANKRQRALEIALNTGVKKKARFTLAKEDRRKCAEDYEKTDSRVLASRLFSKVYTKQDSWSLISGLLIHDCDAPESSGSQDISASWASCLLSMVYWQETKLGIALSHVSSRWASPEAKRELRDTTGIFRSLACQLIERSYQIYDKPMSFEYVDDDLAISISDSELVPNLKLFRQLLCDLAAHVAKHKKPKQKIFAILDCSELSGAAGTGLPTLLHVLRALCDEMSVGELGQYIDFQYLLL